jgi:crossover junction endodeoxyribonuclease RusA
MTRIELPWPPRELHPNTRIHWAKKAPKTRAARQWAQTATWKAGVRGNDQDIPIAIKATVVFCPPDKRARDIDGMLSSIKAYLDGISDVIGVDDSKWQLALRREDPRKGGAVFVELEAA